MSRFVSESFLSEVIPERGPVVWKGSEPPSWRTQGIPLPQPPRKALCAWERRNKLGFPMGQQDGQLALPNRPLPVGFADKRQGHVLSSFWLPLDCPGHGGLQRLLLYFTPITIIRLCPPGPAPLRAPGKLQGGVLETASWFLVPSLTKFPTAKSLALKVWGASP